MGVVFGAFASIWAMSSALSGEQVPVFKKTSCYEELLQSFPPGDCSPYNLFIRQANEDTQAHWVDEIRCHFKNQLTLYVFEEDQQIILDIKGLTGRSDYSNHTEKFSSCADLKNWIENWKNILAPNFTQAEERDFQDRTSVSFILSSETCRILQPEIDVYLSLLRNEGRLTSESLCVPQKIVSTRNPAEIRKYLSEKIHPANSLILIGRDLPPFEYFYVEANSEEYKYGMTDLPYGEFESSFWSSPISKSHRRLKEKIYRSKDYIYSLTGPSLYAFDLSDFVSEFVNDPKIYRQSRSVSRWISNSNQSETIQKDFQNFLDRRTHYRPKKKHRAVMVRDGEFLFDPEDQRIWPMEWADQEGFRKNLPPGSESILLTEADTEGVMKFLSKETTLLHLSAHGHPLGIGNLSADSLSEISWAPEFIDLNSCNAGSWALEGFSGTLMGSLFSIPEPPLAVVGAQAVKFFITLGTPDRISRDVFLSGWRVGQSLGSRQAEAFNLNLELHANGGLSFSDLRTFFGQAFASLSVFGDPTIEL